jgi:cell shape-determining protein MreC
MSYLLDRKNKRKRYLGIAFGVFLVVIIFYFRVSIFGGLSYVSHTIFRPVLVVSTSVKNKFSGTFSFFSYKNTLIKQNQDLEAELAEKNNQIANYNSILAENTELKDILNRKENPNVRDGMVLGAILSKPNASLYDTLVIDIGDDQGIKSGDVVFALGNVPIGKVESVFPSTSKVALFSTSSEATEVIISGKNIFMQLVGRGGGNFEMILPRDFDMPKGAEVVLPGIHPYPVAIAETIISDPRDAFAKALLVSPVNIQELKYVEVKRGSR